MGKHWKLFFKIKTYIDTQLRKSLISIWHKSSAVLSVWNINLFNKGPYLQSPVCCCRGKKFLCAKTGFPYQKYQNRDSSKYIETAFSNTKTNLWKKSTEKFLGRFLEHTLYNKTILGKNRPANPFGFIESKFSSKNSRCVPSKVRLYRLKGNEIWKFRPKLRERL